MIFFHALIWLKLKRPITWITWWISAQAKILAQLAGLRFQLSFLNKPSYGDFIEKRSCNENLLKLYTVIN